MKSHPNAQWSLTHDIAISDEDCKVIETQDIEFASYIVYLSSIKALTDMRLDSASNMIVMSLSLKDVKMSREELIENFLSDKVNVNCMSYCACLRRVKGIVVNFHKKLRA